MGRKGMDEMWRGGPWYVVDFRRMEFVTRTSRLNRETATAKPHWTPRIGWARAYKTQSAAVMIANAINAARGRNDCQALGRMAAVCVDGINRRDGLPARGNRGDDLIRPPAAATFP